MSGYTKGFSGVASQNYFTRVHEAIQAGENALSQGENTITQMASPNDNTGQNREAFVEGTFIKRYEQAVDGLHVAYSPGTVVSNDEIYRYVSSSHNQYDDEMTNKILHAIVEMENLLTHHLQVPTATPKIEAILEEVKSSLPQSSSLAQANANEITRFYQNIVSVDEGSGFGGQRLVLIGDSMTISAKERNS